MVYGLSRREREEWLKVGFSAGALASGVALLNLPGWLNSTLGFTVAKYFGGAGAIIGGIIFVASGGGFVLFAELAKRRKPPRFFWQSFS